MQLINQKEWEKLYEQGVIEPVEYNLDSRFTCNHLLNSIIHEDKFLYRLLFDNIAYNLKVMPVKDYIHSKTLLDLEFGELNSNDFNNGLDHYQIIQFDQNWSNIEGIECFKGIFNFPYNHHMEYIIKNMDDHGELWETYIINPRFLQYNKSCIGIFYMLNVDLIEELISNLNGYFIKLTGYPLFFKPTLDTIDEIKPITLEISRKNFIKPFMKENPSEEHIMFYKLLKFWAENECVNVKEFKRDYERYSENIQYGLTIGFNLKYITSNIPFELIHNSRPELNLGPFTRFEYDPHFNCAYTEDNEIKLTNIHIREFSKGNYDFKLLK